jgi:Subtilase family
MSGVWTDVWPLQKVGPPVLQPALRKPADLYACWALATDWRGYKRSQEGLKLNQPVDANSPDALNLRILARAKDAQELQAAIASGHLDVPGVYGRAVPGAQSPALHFTATVKGKAGTDWLFSPSCALKWELAIPNKPGLSVAQADTAGRYGPERDEAFFNTPGAPKIEASKVKSGEIGDAIAVIDFGCPFVNARFLDGTAKPRIAALWDQNKRAVTSVAPWNDGPPRLGYGRELGGKAIQALSNSLRKKTAAAIDADEATLYRRLDYLVNYDDPRRRVWLATHGAIVLDMAGGTVDPLAEVLPEQVNEQDAASKAQLIFVQLPALTAADASGGSLGAQILDGVRYVMDRCDPNAKLVINISYGTFAGPHDGSSMIERALDELLTLRDKNFAIVVAAGNARESNCHMRREVKKNQSALFRVALDAQDVTDTFVELWYPVPKVKTTRLRARVRTAGRDWCKWISAGGAAQLNDPATGRPLGLLQHELSVPQSMQSEKALGQKALMLLALAPTAPTVDDDGPLNEPGIWEIEVALDEPADADADASVVVEAWVERDDPGEWGAGAVPRFVGLDRDDAHNTLGSLSTGTHTVVVGGYRWSDGLPAPYSSLPALNSTPSKLMLYAPCEESAEHNSLPGAAVASNDVRRMNGTSVAAPVAARRIYNALVSKKGPVRRAAWPKLLEDLTGTPNSVLKRPG